MMTEGVTHLPVTNTQGKLVGIVTAWDVSKAVALKYTLREEIMTSNVVISAQEDPIERSAKRMNEHNISALPVVDANHWVIGMINKRRSSPAGERVQMMVATLGLTKIF
jgi:homoserine O-acetyltransferase